MTLRCRLHIRSLGFLALLLALSARASAEPCCLNLTCLDLDPAVCLSQGGIVGFCLLGEPCGALACTATLIRPIEGVQAVKVAATGDVLLVWTPDPNADRYDVFYVTDKRDVPAGPGDRPVPGATPTTVAAAVHEGPPPEPVLYYEVTGDCPGRGACCTFEFFPCCQEGLTFDQCLGINGVFQGVGTVCFPEPCLCEDVLGACCHPLFGCFDLPEFDCIMQGGTFLGPGTTCSFNPCPGACCTPGGSCLEGIDEPTCRGGGGEWFPGFTCRTAPCGNCCLNGLCEFLDEPFCTDLGGTPTRCVLGASC